MVCLRWAEGDDAYDVIPTSTIRRPVTLQALPHLADDAVQEDDDTDPVLPDEEFIFNHFL